MRELPSTKWRFSVEKMRVCGIIIHFWNRYFSKNVPYPNRIRQQAYCFQNIARAFRNARLHMLCKYILITEDFRGNWKSGYPRFNPLIGIGNSTLPDQTLIPQKSEEQLLGAHIHINLSTLPTLVFLFIFGRAVRVGVRWHEKETSYLTILFQLIHFLSDFSPEHYALVRTYQFIFNASWLSLFRGPLNERAFS